MSRENTEFTFRMMSPDRATWVTLLVLGNNEEQAEAVAVEKFKEMFGGAIPEQIFITP